MGKRAAFRLQPVLELRRTQERAAAQAAAQAANAAADADRHATERESPLVGASPPVSAAPGAFVASCHSGVTLAAAHALELAPRIAEGALDSRFAAFSTERFHVSKAA